VLNWALIIHPFTLTALKPLRCTQAGIVAVRVTDEKSVTLMQGMIMNVQGRPGVTG
jgi:hypothetical protein